LVPYLKTDFEERSGARRLSDEKQEWVFHPHPALKLPESTTRKILDRSIRNHRDLNGAAPAARPRAPEPATFRIAAVQYTKASCLGTLIISSRNSS
jgi:hypothetical protein